MMKRYYFIVLLAFCGLSLHAQLFISGVHQNLINKSLLEGKWPAYWITVPNESVNVSGVYHFRRNLYLDTVPDNYVVHISADNKYKLYVNERLVSIGPVVGDSYNWNFETIDLKPYLKTGKNVFAFVVWNYAEWKPTALISRDKVGLLIQGNDSVQQDINSGKGWKCIKNQAYSFGVDGTIIGYYAAGPSERVDLSLYPWGWETLDYDDSQWIDVEVGEQAAIKGTRDYAGRPLVPSPIPTMELKKQRLVKIRKSDGVKIDDSFLQGNADLSIPPYSKVCLLLDNRYLTTGYFSVVLSGGRNSKLDISYAEALYSPFSDSKPYYFNKGNRDVINGKEFYGIEDRLVIDGGIKRCYTSLWWRTWRYVQLQIETKGEPLVLHDVYGTFTAYPFQRVSKFEAGSNEYFDQILDIGWRTARLCAHETYMDCPYYEQLQYFGDTRIQAMITMFNTKDSCMVKQAIDFGKRSLTPEGITMSRYPSNSVQFIPSYSLSWIGMSYDYWMYRGDDNYVRSLLPAIRRVLSWYEQWLKNDYSLERIPYWFFIDWADGFVEGEPYREKKGNSALQDLIFLIALDEATVMEQNLGLQSLSIHYQNIAKKIREGFKQKYWDCDKKLFSDTQDKLYFSQHTNTFALLANIVTGEEAKELFKRILSDSSIIQASLYFRYYINQAMDKVGLGDLLLNTLGVWEEQIALGLTTWAETSEPSRSDCHAWGACLNIEFFRILLGIKSTGPGFKEVLIDPCLGRLKDVRGKIPHPHGEISVSYKVREKTEIMISLPKGVSGTLIWKNKKYKLVSGEQCFMLR